MATKTLTRSEQAEAKPVETERVEGGYTNGWWAIRGPKVQLGFDCEQDIQAAAEKIVDAGFLADIDREVAKIAALPPFANLRNLRARIAESELTITATREKIAALKSSLGPSASDTDVERVRKGVDDCEVRIREATLQGENARRFTADSFAECEKLARESLPALKEIFRDRAANFVTHVGDQFWAAAKDFFLKMSVAEQQTGLIEGYLSQVGGNVNLILDPSGHAAEMFRLSCATA